MKFPPSKHLRHLGLWFLRIVNLVAISFPVLLLRILELMVVRVSVVIASPLRVELSDLVPVDTDGVGHVVAGDGRHEVRGLALLALSALSGLKVPPVPNSPPEPGRGLNSENSQVKQSKRGGIKIFAFCCLNN